MFNQFDPEHICLGCMAGLQTEGPCPRCGFDGARYEAPPHQLRPGAMLGGKYLVGRSLGEGGFGITYIGFDLNLELRVAVKEYYPNGLATRQVSGTMSVLPFTSEAEQYGRGLDRFVQEAKSLARFHDLDGIVSVKDFFRENGTAYIVMEYIEGETLKQYILEKGGRLPMEEALSLLRPVMESLALVHGAGVIHRDISPDNIMLTRRGAKLIDFGAARTYVDEENRSRTVTLKSGYAPYEQYQTRGEQGPYTDVYALCATIYKCATGTTPPEATDRMAEDALQPLSALGAAIDPKREAALLKGLAVKAKDRYRDIPQLNAALFQTAAGPEPINPEPAPPAPEPQPKPKPEPKAGKEKPWQKKRIRAAAIAVIAVPLAAALLSGLLRPAEQEAPAAAPTPLAETTPMAALATPAPAEILPAAAPAAAPNVRTAGPERMQGRGNSSVNINNSGRAAQQGDWIYYEGEPEGLYKERLDGTGREALVDSGWAQNISVVGDWVYYLQVSGVSRIRTDGSGREFLFENPAYPWQLQLHVVDDVFYYMVDLGESNAIYRRSVGGSPQILYGIDNPDTFVDIEAVEDGWIYFYEFTPNGSTLMKMTLEGSELTSLAQGSGLMYTQVIGDAVYYLDDSDSTVYRMDTDGSNKTAVLDSVYDSFHISGDWIYYPYYENYEAYTYKRDGRLYKSRLDGSERTQLANHEAHDLCIAGDWVFYMGGYAGSAYRMKTDGTQDNYAG